MPDRKRRKYSCNNGFVNCVSNERSLHKVASIIPEILESKQPVASISVFIDLN